MRTIFSGNGGKMPNRILLEIDCDALQRLLAAKGLTLRDFSCPDFETKQRVQDMYLSLLSNPPGLS
jgi:hypothetical protein